MFECVIFDIDGTLIDTEKAAIRSLQRVLKEEQGRDYAYDELTFAMGLPGSATLERLGVNSVESVWKKWIGYFREYREETGIFPGVEKVLQELYRKKIRMGVVTSKCRNEIIYDFEPSGLSKYFQTIVCADDTVKHKPEPEPMLKLLELSGTDASHAVYVGDTINDLQCAKGAGVAFALALWGAKNPEKIQADYKLKKPEDLLQIL